MLCRTHRIHYCGRFFGFMSCCIGFCNLHERFNRCTGNLRYTFKIISRKMLFQYLIHTIRILKTRILFNYSITVFLKSPMLLAVTCILNITKKPIFEFKVRIYQETRISMCYNVIMLYKIVC